MGVGKEIIPGYIRLDKLNIPPYCIDMGTLKRYVSGELWCIISNFYPEGYLNEWAKHSTPLTEDPTVRLLRLPHPYIAGAYQNIGYYFDGIFVDYFFWNNGWSKKEILEPFNSRILYVKDIGFKYSLPYTPDSFSLVPKEGHVPINLPDDICCFVDLFSNLHRFSRLNNEYRVLDPIAAKKNLTRSIKQYRIYKEMGNDGARIADYGKVVQLLLKVVYPSLTENQKNILLPLINSPEVSDSGLRDIVGRELKIQEILRGIDEDINDSFNIPM